MSEQPKSKVEIETVAGMLMISLPGKNELLSGSAPEMGMELLLKTRVISISEIETPEIVETKELVKLLLFEKTGGFMSNDPETSIEAENSKDIVSGELGTVVGSTDGSALGAADGLADGSSVGSTEGSTVGKLVGFSEGAAEGVGVGSSEG